MSEMHTYIFELIDFHWRFPIPFVVPDESEVLLLRYLLNNQPPTDLVLHLYSNNKTPGSTDTLSDYTEVSAAGYAPFTLGGSNWSFSSVSGVAQATYVKQTFTLTTSAQVYGCYYTDDTSTNLLWAEKFASLLTVDPSGGTVSVNPKAKLKDIN